MGIYLFGKFGKMIAMDVYHHRRENVRHLCQKEHNGSLSEMANRLDRQQSLISRWIGQTKTPKHIGSRTARRIEREYKKPEGWLDIPQNVFQIKEIQAKYATENRDKKRLALSDDAIAIAEKIDILPEHFRRHLCLLINDVLISKYGNKETQKAYAASSDDEQLLYTHHPTEPQKKGVRKKRKYKK